MTKILDREPTPKISGLAEESCLPHCDQDRAYQFIINEVWNSCVISAVIDPAFRDRLMHSPKEVLASLNTERTGEHLKISSNLTLKVLSDSHSCLNIVLKTEGQEMEPSGSIGLDRFCQEARMNPNLAVALLADPYATLKNWHMEKSGEDLDLSFLKHINVHIESQDTRFLVLPPLLEIEDSLGNQFESNPTLGGHPVRSNVATYCSTCESTCEQTCGYTCGYSCGGTCDYSCSVTCSNCFTSSYQRCQ